MVVTTSRAPFRTRETQINKINTLRHDVGVPFVWFPPEFGGARNMGHVYAGGTVGAFRLHTPRGGHQAVCATMTKSDMYMSQVSSSCPPILALFDI